MKCRPALGQHISVIFFDEIGDLASPENQAALEELVERQSAGRLICDRHPGYFSRQLAHRLAREKNLPLKEIQHHRAHVAAVCLEHGLIEETVVGLAFDGTGYGDDGIAWGGEFFVGSIARGFERKAHFAALPLPGGDAAVLKPWRIALALLVERGADSSLLESWVARHHLPVQDLALFQKALSIGLAVGRSTALGRWFDAAAALLGVGTLAAFEAQPAVALQKLAEEHLANTPLPSCPFQIQPGDPIRIDFPDLARLAESKTEDLPGLAKAFHLAVAEATAQVAGHLAETAGTRRVIASGGCFLNSLLDRLIAERLSALGLQYLKPKILPPGDQAIALGQIGLALLSPAD